MVTIIRSFQFGIYPELTFKNSLTGNPTEEFTSFLQANLYCNIDHYEMFVFFVKYKCGSLMENREIGQKSPSRRVATICSRLRTSVRATKGVSSVCEPLPPDRPLWFPGSSPPDWLDGRQIFLYFFFLSQLFNAMGLGLVSQVQFGSTTECSKYGSNPNPEKKKVNLDPELPGHILEYHLERSVVYRRIKTKNSHGNRIFMF